MTTLKTTHWARFERMNVVVCEEHLREINKWLLPIFLSTMMSFRSAGHAADNRGAKRVAIHTEERGTSFPEQGELAFSGGVFPRRQPDAASPLPGQNQGSFGKSTACGDCFWKQSYLKDTAAKAVEDVRRSVSPSETQAEA